MYDAIVIGAGHNGLVTAAKLGKAGKKVLLLEQRSMVGGAAVTEEIHPGFRCSTLAYTPGLFQQSFVEEFQLRSHGYETIEGDPAIFAPLSTGEALTFYNDAAKTRESIAKYAPADADNYVKFEQDMDRMVALLRPLLLNPLPDPVTVSARDARELLQFVWRMRKSKRRDVLMALRILPMSIADLLNEYFTNDHLKGVLASEGVLGSYYGPRSAGSVYVMLYLRLGSGNGKRSWPFVRGGMGALTQALAQAAQKNGAEIRTGAAVKQILIKQGVAHGVVLSTGEEIEGRMIVSNADAKKTLLHLVDVTYLDPEFSQKVRNIKSRGVSAKVNFALDSYPQWKGVENGFQPASITIAPNMNYLERAFDDAKYGSYSRAPFLDIVIPSVVDSSLAPEGKHVMSVYVLFAPYHLRNGDWNALRESFGDVVTETIEQYAPGFSDAILRRQIITPLDLENTYGMTEGHIHHGEHSLDQIFFMRPVAGYSRYRTPIANLYLCSAATHPGGGVTGIPGSLAAAAVLEDFKK